MINFKLKYPTENVNSKVIEIIDDATTNAVDDCTSTNALQY